MKGNRGSGRAARETVYAITSVSAEQAPPAELARHIRGHWHVENSGIRNLAISLLRLAGHTNIVKALRHNARKHKRAIKLILTS